MPAHHVVGSLLLSFGALAACSGSATEPKSCSFSARPAADTAPIPRNDWRAKVLQRASSVPADSILEAAFFGVTDNTLFAPYGGEVKYSFRGFRAVLVLMPASGMRRFASDPGSDPENFIFHAEFGLPHYLLGCA